MVLLDLSSLKKWSVQDMKKRKNYMFLAIVLNPLVLVIYGITCFYLYSLLQYGGVKRKVPIIIVGFFLLLVWALWCIFKGHKKIIISKWIGISKTWLLLALFLFLSTTFYTGYRIYQSGIKYQGKLSWFIDDLKNKRKIKFVHNDIYEDNIEGIFKDIRERISLPEDLYLSSNFSLRFDKNGKISSFDTYLYGRDDKGENQSFLISYDSKKDKDIIVYLRGYVNTTFDKEKKLQPLMELLQWIPIKEVVNEWEEQEYGILYTGVRDWGYNTEGIVYIDETGSSEIDFPEDRIIGYSLSVYVPGKEDQIIPVRFIHNKYKDFSIEEEEIKWEIGYNYNEGDETFFLNENLGYQLGVVDAALGSRFYSLFLTNDGGKTWDTLNPDPFLSNLGVSSGITFINESLGFIGLSHSGGSYGELYRTEDGGVSFELVSIPEIEIESANKEFYTPFDYPMMPYREGDSLYLLLGQGTDGDYNGGSKALYESKDNGKTWSYLEEVKE